jgi:transposase
MKAQDILCPYTVTIGIDWADSKHDVFERYLDGSICQHEIASAPEAVREWLWALRSRAKGGRVALGIETSRGPLFHSLSQHSDWIDIFPVNPQSLARYRQAFYPSRAKDDPVDSQLLEELIRSHPDRLRIYRPGPEMERKLHLLCQQRRKVIGMAVELENQLRATLKEYFPVAIDLCASNGLRNKLALDFLQRWPTYALLMKARPQTLRSFYYAHNARNQALIEARLARFSSSVPLTEDPAVIEPLSIVAKMLVCAIRAIERTVEQLQDKIATLFGQHPDHLLFENLPGAGKNLAPRLLCVFGSDRSCWPDATAIQKYSGIAPVMERSGKSSWVHRRLFRPKFLCQTFHEFAGQSIHHSKWAAVFYERQRGKGKSHTCAIRALAFKWIRIIFRCWKSRKPYDETLYLRSIENQYKKSLKII